MDKIGIITLNGYFNYGNRLQNYALQEVINTFGYDCETILNNTFINKNDFQNKSKINKFLNSTLNEKIKMLNNKINREKIRNLNEKRIAIFKDFSKKYIKETNFSISVNNIPENLSEKYKYFISGSDQVWNPNDCMVSEVNFLTFAPKEKRLTYAPSFGVSQISNKYINDYKLWLSNMENLSVREEAGASIIKELTGKDSTVVLDPTMLINKEQWIHISKKHIYKPKKEYLLTYFLGGISKEYKNKIKEISKKHNLEVVNLANEKYMKYFLTGPSEFIDYINSAKLFVTDSFHGCVFSLLLQTPFIVCDRNGHSNLEKMSSRIDTFVQKFKLESRKFCNISDNELFNINYENANEILKIERDKSWNYLKSIIK